MAINNEIIFDDKSGISIEEQKEILSKINGIAEKNRRSLSQGAEGKTVINAKKTGVLFPLLFNITALLILAGGSFLLYSFNSKVDVQIREGSAVYDLTERTLIDEIRKDTANKLSEKENEIGAILSRMEDVDSQLVQLYSSNQELTAEQLATQARLLETQNAYRTDLSALQDERSRILEDSRTRESRLRAQFEERTREFAAAQQRTSSELAAAMNELEQLTNEQERIAAIDSQLAGGIAAIKDQIHREQYDQALLTIENMRFFNNNNVFANARSYQSRREFYNNTLNSLEEIISHLHRASGVDSGRENFDLQAKNIQLENTIAEMQRTIDAFSSGSSAQVTRLNELETRIRTIEAEKSAVETEKGMLDAEKRALETEKNTLNVTIAAREERIRELESQSSAQGQQIITLNEQISNLRQEALRIFGQQ